MLSERILLSEERAKIFRHLSVGRRTATELKQFDNITMRSTGAKIIYILCARCHLKRLRGDWNIKWNTDILSKDSLL